MKNNVKIVNLLTAVSMMVSSTQVYAIDLNTKIQNTDKSDFNTINSPFRYKNKKSSVSLEYSNTKNPLILKRSDGSTVPLIEGLTVMEFSMLYGITDSLQLGILIPGENPYGIVAPFDDAKKYLGNILIEPKIYLMDNIAFIPLYYIPGSSKINGIGNSQSDLDLGKDKGGYGAKLSMGFGDKEKSDSILTAVQIGAIMAPESKFRINQTSSEIDQTQRLQFGVGISYPVSGTMRLLVEAYGEKTKNNTPMESIATIEYKNDNFMMRLGGGTGDLQGSGSNTAKVLANFTYYFGSEKETAKNTLSSPPPSDRFEDRLREIKRKDNNEPILKDEPIEEQNEPTSGQVPFGGIVRNDLMIEPRRIPINATRIPVPKQKPIPEPDNHVFVLFDRKRSKDDFFLIGEDDDDSNRMPASEASTLTEEEIILKAKENIKNAIKLIDNNLYLHQKAQIHNDQEEMKKLEVELRWGLRVYKKNIKTLNDLIKNETVLEFNLKVKEAQNILDGVPSGQALEFFVINTNKVIVKSSESTNSRDNTLFKLSQGEEVVVLGNVTYGDYVQIKMVKGRFENYEYPMFISKKYLSKREDISVLAKDEPKKEVETIVPQQQEFEVPLSEEEIAEIKKQLDEIELILEQKLQQDLNTQDLELHAPIDIIEEEKKEEKVSIKEEVKVVNPIVVETPNKEEVNSVIESQVEKEIILAPVENENSKKEIVESIITEIPAQQEVIEPVILATPVTEEVKESVVLDLPKEEIQLTIEESNEIKQEIKEEVKKVVEENPPVELKVENKLVEESVVEKQEQTVTPIKKEEAIVEKTVSQEVELKTEDSVIVEIPVLEQEVKKEEPVVESPVPQQENASKVEEVIAELPKEIENKTEEIVKEDSKVIIEVQKKESKTLEEILAEKPLTVDSIVEEIKEASPDVKVEEVKILTEEPVVNHLEEEKAKFRSMLDSELDKVDEKSADKKSNEKDELFQLVNEAEESARNIKATDREMVKKLPEKVNNQQSTIVNEIRKDLPSQDINKELETIVVETESPKVEQSLESKEIAPTPVIIEEMQSSEIVVEQSKENQEIKAETPIFLEESKDSSVKEEVKKSKNQSVDSVIEPNKVEIVTEEEKTSMKDLLLQDVKKEDKKLEIVEEKEKTAEEELSKMADKEKLEAQIKFEKEQQEKQKLIDKVEKERLDALKKKELDQIDQYLELKAQSKKDVKVKEEELTKDVVTEELKKEKQSVKESDSPFKELIKKSKESGDALEEEGEIEEQNGPSFGEI